MNGLHRHWRIVLGIALLVLAMLLLLPGTAHSADGGVFNPIINRQ